MHWLLAEKRVATFMFIGLIQVLIRAKNNLLYNNVQTHNVFLEFKVYVIVQCCHWHNVYKHINVGYQCSQHDVTRFVFSKLVTWFVFLMLSIHELCTGSCHMHVCNGFFKLKHKLGLHYQILFHRAEICIAKIMLENRHTGMLLGQMTSTMFTCKIRMP